MNILVTNWEEVEKDDSYLMNDWLKLQEIDKDRRRELKRLQKMGQLYKAYIVPAENFALYYEMDAEMVFIDIDFNIVLYCESEIIGTDFEVKRPLEV